MPLKGEGSGLFHVVDDAQMGIHTDIFASADSGGNHMEEVQEKIRVRRRWRFHVVIPKNLTWIDAAPYSNQWKVAGPFHAKGFLSNEEAGEKKFSSRADEDGVHDEDDYGIISSPFFLRGF